MKFSIFIVAVTWIFITVADTIPDGDVVKQCQVDLNMSDDDVKKAQNIPTGVPVSEEVKCYTKCLMEKFGIANADGTLNAEASANSFSSGDRNKYDLIVKEFPYCEAMGEGQTACSAVHSFLECIMDIIHQN